MSGAGTQPAGISPFGLGEPDTALFTPGGAVNVNTSTGLQEGARFIDPYTKQYVYDATTGRAIGMPATRQRVQLAAMTALRSSAQLSLGHNLAAIQTMGDDYEMQVTSTLTAALQPLVDDGSIVLNGIDVLRADARSGSRNVIRFTDLTTNTAQTLTV